MTKRKIILELGAGSIDPWYSWQYKDILRAKHLPRSDMPFPLHYFMWAVDGKDIVIRRNENYVQNKRVIDRALIERGSDIYNLENLEKIKSWKRQFQNTLNDLKDGNILYVLFDLNDLTLSKKAMEDIYGKDNVVAIQGNYFEGIPFGSGTIDEVIFRDRDSNAQREKSLKIFDEIRRVLKPNGKLYENYHKNPDPDNFEEIDGKEKFAVYKKRK